MLAAIYNVWDGEEHLEESILSIRNTVSHVLCVCQTVSNLGEHYTGGHEESLRLKDKGLVDTVILFEPKGMPQACEIQKRQHGIEWAKDYYFPAFILIDCDEIYRPKEFESAYQKWKGSGACGSVAKIITYIKEKNLGFEDSYFVPAFHRLNQSTQTGAKQYPFYVDPTRRIDCGNVIELELTMHHYSYIRKDIDLKLRNSTAYVNLLRKRNIILEDLQNAAPGYYSKFFQQELKII